MSEGLTYNEPRPETPLRPAYAFNLPGASVALYEGPIAGLADGQRPGRIELNCGPRVGLRWRAELQPDDHRVDLGQIPLTVHRAGRDWTIEAHERRSGEGWINQAIFERPNASLQRVLVQWMNLPEIIGPVGLVESTGGSKRWWLGRWRADVDGWRLMLDVRPEYTEAMDQAHETHLYLFTHVMQIRRADDSEFDVDAVSRLLECLRVTFSFAFGRWVAPVLPVGYDRIGGVAYEAWTSPICDPAKSVGSPWLYRGRPEDLTELVRCSVPAFRDTTGPGNTRFQMSLAVQAVEAGFVEQRILAAAPALEHLAWAELVLGKRWTRNEYDERYAEDRLRYLLQLAHIPTDINPIALPALWKFAQPNRLDGPTAATRVRNRLIHPQTPQDQIYRHDGLVEDAWRLTRRYVTLLLLHSIGYRGAYIDPVHTTGWEGTTAPVPWDTATPIPTPTTPPTKKYRPRPNRRLAT
ncbi:MAG TPA: hypothetical protein VIR54_22260 [Vicinamibacterales bacterium]